MKKVIFYWVLFLNYESYAIGNNFGVRAVNELAPMLKSLADAFKDASKNFGMNATTKLADVSKDVGINSATKIAEATKKDQYE